MKVVFFNRSFHPDMASTGVLLSNLAKALKEKYHFSITVITGFPYHPFTKEYLRGFPFVKENFNGVNIIRVWSCSIFKEKIFFRFLNYIIYLLFSFVAGFYIERPDVIVSLTDPPIIGLIAYFHSKRFNSRFVFWCHDIFPEQAIVLDGFKNKYMFFLLDKLFIFLLRKSQIIIAIGETMKRRLIERKNIKEEKICIINNWTDCSKIYPVYKDNIFRKKYNLNGKFVIMYSGNVGLSQNIDIMVDLAEEFRDDFSKIFLVIGDGVKKRLMQEKVALAGLSNILFLPYQPPDEMCASLSAADVHIITLKRGLSGYSMPSKIYNILASGRVFIAAVDYDCEVAEIARRYRCGLVCAPSDIKSMSYMIKKLHSDPELRSFMDRRCREIAHLFDFNISLNLFYKIFLDLCR